MSNLNAFLKQNKKERANVKFVASEDFKNEKGNPIEWEIRPLKSKEMDHIRTICTKIGKKGKETDFDSQRFNRLVTSQATVFPDLNNKDLQDNYGVMCAEDLIVELLDRDADYLRYLKKVNEVAGYDKAESELVEEVKN